MARKKQCDMGDYIVSKKDMEAYVWCIRNKIFISPKAKSINSWYIVIDLKNKINVSPDAYGKKEIWKKLYEYYRYYHDKYK